jgi:hypothetical protein
MALDALPEELCAQLRASFESLLDEEGESDALDLRSVKVAVRSFSKCASDDEVRCVGPCAPARQLDYSDKSMSIRVV